MSTFSADFEPPEGQMSDHPMAQLLAWAFNQGFTGSLVVRGRAGTSGALTFIDGAPIRGFVPENDAQLEEKALEEHLPPEQLDFARRHASARKMSLLLAVAQLHLLDAGVLYGVHRDKLRGIVVQLSAAEAAQWFRFFPNEDCFEELAGYEAPVHPLGLIHNSIVSSPFFDSFRRAVERSHAMPLWLLDPEPSLGPELPPVMRAIVTQLSAGSQTLRSLQHKRLATHNQLAAAVFALRVCGMIAASKALMGGATATHGIQRSTKGAFPSAIGRASELLLRGSDSKPMLSPTVPAMPAALMPTVIESTPPVSGPLSRSAGAERIARAFRASSRAPIAVTEPPTSMAREKSGRRIALTPWMSVPPQRRREQGHG